MKPMKRVIPVFASVLLVAPTEAVPPPQLIKGPPPNIAMGKRLIVPANGMPGPGAVNIPSRKPRRAITEEHLLTRSGETIHGTFKGFDANMGVTWSHPDFLPAVVQFLPDRVSRLNFKVAPLPARARQHSCQVELPNGDRIAGDLMRMDDGKLILNTWYAGELAVNTAHIKSIQPGTAATKVFFEGPKDAKNWTFTNLQNARVPLNILPNIPQAQQQLLKERMAQAAKGPNWKLANGTFESSSSNAMVGRHMKETPGRSSTEFDLEWSGSMNLYINFLTDSLNSYSQCNGYCLRLNQSYVYLYRYNFNNGAARGARVGNNVRITNLRGNAHVAIKLDKPKKTIALLINGVLVQKWANLGELPGDGNGLLFTSRTTNRMKLSRIRVTEWNGALPEPKNKAQAEIKEDLVILHNSDHMTGQVLGIAEGKLHFKSAFGEMKISLEKVREIHRATSRVKPVPAMAGLGRAIFKEAGSLAMKITGWKNGKVTASSPLFGEAAFDATAFEAIDFTGATQQASGGISPVNSTSRIEEGFRAMPRPFPQRAIPAPQLKRLPNGLQLELNVRPQPKPQKIVPRR